MKKFFTFFACMMAISWVVSALPVWSDTGGPDGYGYRYIDSSDSDGPDYVWHNDYTSLDGNDLDNDELSDAVDIGFPFTFYGETYDELYISSNGFLSFEDMFGSGCCHGEEIPTSGGSNAVSMIAAVWDDLNPGG